MKIGIDSRGPPGVSQPSENPTFTLFYFNVKALAEPIRFLFAYGGQEYEDVRVTRDEWPALKPSMLPQKMGSSIECLFDRLVKKKINDTSQIINYTVDAPDKFKKIIFK